MKALQVDPGYKPKLVTVPQEQQKLDALCGGTLTLQRFAWDAAGVLYCPEAAEQNRRYNGRWLPGRLLIVGVQGNRLCSLTAGQIEMYAKHWTPAVGGDEDRRGSNAGSKQEDI